jgi:hypothetical protein
MIAIELCDCHPVKVHAGFFRIFTNYSYEELLIIAPVGKVCVQLARPMKGYHDHGWYVVLFGRVITFTPMRVKGEE